jgi:beta-lactamase superfamily II metal-dependent hydrolase
MVKPSIIILLVLVFALVVNVNADLTIYFIDVGQGDAELLESNGHYMLIDAGPSDAGNAVVSFLRSLGVNELDVVVATHPHEDHIGGMVDVLRAFPVNLYVDNGETTTTKTYENLVSEISSQYIPYAEAASGDEIPFANGINVEIVNPSSLNGDLNENSLVLKVTDGSVKYLFMGDASDGSGDLSAQILKVTHHGSNSGTTAQFLNKVNPEIAVIEVGSDNSYGHPASITIDNLLSKGVKIYRTDENGNIVIGSDGSTYTISNDKKIGSNQAPAKTPKPTVSTPKPTPIKTQSPVYVAPVQVAAPVSPSSGPCNCNGPDKNCGDFSSHSAAQACFDYCKNQGYGDCFKLDKDANGLACESMK